MNLITSARRADVSLLARPTHACTCYYKFPGYQGRGQPVWIWAAATGYNSVYLYSFSRCCLPNIWNRAKFQENSNLHQYKGIQGHRPWCQRKHEWV